jgi:hypothetical protein
LNVRRSRLHTSVQNLYDVQHFEIAVIVGRLHGILETRNLVGTADCKDLGSDGDRLLDPILRQPLDLMVASKAIEPHAPTTSTTAVALLPAAEHLPELDSRDCTEQLARGVVLAVVASEIARVVEGDLLGERLDQELLELIEVLGQELRVVLDRELAASVESS